MKMRHVFVGVALVTGLGCGASSEANGSGTTDAGASGSADSDAQAQSGGEGGTSSGGTSPGPGADGIDIGVISPSLYNTVLGRPTDHSIAVSVLPISAGDEASVDVATGVSPSGDALVGSVVSTEPVVSKEGEPMVIELQDLEPNTRYYYRVRYRAVGGEETPDNIHTFQTQRAPGSTFRFGVQGDTHPERYNNKMFHADLFKLTMEQVRDRQPDLYFMLGDDFSIEKIIEDFKNDNFDADHTFQRSVEGATNFADYQATISEPFVESMLMDGEGAPKGYAAYRSLRESYLGIMANATALFLVNGNHEQAHAANLGGIFNNASVWAANGRLKYYPLPAPNDFYTGDDIPLASVNGYPTIDAEDGLLRDYYAFTWGDALFVTIDPYWHSELVSPDSTLFDGDGKEAPWAATMGDEQYAWLKRTLEGSSAKWKFVFAHHINGDGRGGAALVGAEEWGGSTKDLSTYRPKWDKSIHQLLVDTKVTVFFQGHDHLFAREIVDGVVYQEVPNPGDNSYFAYNCSAYDPATITWPGAAGYGVYDADDGVVLPNTGYLDVTVAPDKVRIDYIRTYRSVDLESNPNGIFSGAEKNGEVAFSYSVPAQATDDLPADFAYDCLGDAPPQGWVYNP